MEIKVVSQEGLVVMIPIIAGLPLILFYVLLALPSPWPWIL